MAAAVILGIREVKGKKTTTLSSSEHSSCYNGSAALIASSLVHCGEMLLLLLSAQVHWFSPVHSLTSRGLFEPRGNLYIKSYKLTGAHSCSYQTSCASMKMRLYLNGKTGNPVFYGICYETVWERAEVQVQFPAKQSWCWVLCLPFKLPLSMQRKTKAAGWSVMLNLKVRVSFMCWMKQRVSSNLG